RPTTHAILSRGAVLSFAELDARMNGVAWALARLGLQSGARIALIGTTSPSYLALILGAARAGIAVALVSPELRGELLRRALGEGAPELVIAEAELDLASELDSGDTRQLSYGDGGELERRILDETGRAFEPAEVPAHADYVYVFTSGTTGFPKPC